MMKKTVRCTKQYKIIISIAILCFCFLCINIFRIHQQAALPAYDVFQWDSIGAAIPTATPKGQTYIKGGVVQVQQSNIAGTSPANTDINDSEQQSIISVSNSNSNSHVYHPNDLHDSHQAVLPLADWEQRSLDVFNDFDFSALPISKFDSKSKDLISSSCHPPDGISSKCCLGSLSKGGETGAQFRWKCAAAMQLGFASLQKQSIDIMQQQQQNRSNNNNEDVSSTGTSTNTCDVCRILELARQYNLTIGFMGDSVQHQVWDGFLCEMQRRSYIVNETAVKNLVKGISYTTVQYKGVARVRSPLWSLSSSSSSSSVDSKDKQDNDGEKEMEDHVKIIYYTQAKVPSQWITQLHEILNETDVLLLGMGLWWNSEMELHRDFGLFLEQISTASKVPLLVHRETTTQHFASPDGSYGRGLFNTTCRALEAKRTTTNSSNIIIPSWRDNAIRKAAVDRGYQVLNVDDPATATAAVSTNLKEQQQPQLWIVPLFHFSATQHNQHPDLLHLRHARTDPDCTHFCASPYMWYPIWRGLRRTMEFKFQ